jgi:hypothetical protein
MEERDMDLDEPVEIVFVTAIALSNSMADSSILPDWAIDWAREERA